MAVSKLIPCMSIPSSGARQLVSDSSSRSFPSAATAPVPAPPEEFRCNCKAMDSRRPSMKKGQYYSEKKPFEVKAASILISPETKTEKGVDPALILAAFTSVLLRNANVLIKRKPWRFPLQAFLEKAIIDCRFFVLLAVAGSLIGSLLCFLDGSFLILESYFQYFHVISQGSSDQQGHIVHLLIEAIDMFLVAIAMLVFGIGLHVSFVGSYPLSKVSQTPQSRYLKNVLSSWGGTGSGMGSVMQSKSKIGQAVVMLLQVGVLEKFSSVPLVTGLDLACFAAALFLSSACVFLLSKLTINSSKN